VQGEGGFYVAPKELMVRLRKLCDEHGIVLIADEIQSARSQKPIVAVANLLTPTEN